MFVHRHYWNLKQLLYRVVSAREVAAGKLWFLPFLMLVMEKRLVLMMSYHDCTEYNTKYCCQLSSNTAVWRDKSLFIIQNFFDPNIYISL